MFTFCMIPDMFYTDWQDGIVNESSVACYKSLLVIENFNLVHSQQNLFQSGKLAPCFWDKKHTSTVTFLLWANRCSTTTGSSWFSLPSHFSSLWLHPSPTYMLLNHLAVFHWITEAYCWSALFFFLPSFREKASVLSSGGHHVDNLLEF